MNLRLCKLVAALALLSLAMACGGGGDAASEGSKDMESRLQDALAIKDDKQRDQALSKLAGEAAAANDGAVVLHAVKTITDPALKDKTVSEVVPKLVAAGQRSVAMGLANEMSSPQLREAMLKKLGPAPQ